MRSREGVDLDLDCGFRRTLVHPGEEGRSRGSAEYYLIVGRITRRGGPRDFINQRPLTSRRDVGAWEDPTTLQRDRHFGTEVLTVP